MASAVPPSPPRSGVRDGWLHTATVAWALVGIAVLSVVLFRLLSLVRDVFPPLVLALALIFLLNPAVSALERRGVPRLLGTLAAYLLFLSFLFVAGFLLIPSVVNQLQDLVQRLPELGQRVTRWGSSLAARFGVDLETSADELFQRFRGELSGVAARVASFTRSALHVVVIFVLAPIFALYLLVDLPRLQRSFVDHLPARHRDEWCMLLERCGQAVGGFFRGQLLVALIVGLLSSLALWVVGIPAWLAIGLLAGLFNLIPLVGPFVGGALAMLIGGVAGGPTKALLAGLAMLAVQQIDNHLISPNVMGRAVRLHPVTVMVGLLGGATVAGLWGMLLAVPTIAVGKILMLHYYSTHVLNYQTTHILEVPGGAEIQKVERAAVEEFELPAGEADRRGPAHPSSDIG